MIHLLKERVYRAVARALIGGGGGGCIFIYSGRARLVSFEIKLISKEVSRAEPEYMNIHPPPISVLATALCVYQYGDSNCNKVEHEALHNFSFNFEITYVKITLQSAN